MEFKTIDDLLEEFAQEREYETYSDFCNDFTLDDGEWRGICIKYANQFIKMAYKSVKDYNPNSAPLQPIFNKATILDIQDLIEEQ